MIGWQLISEHRPKCADQVALLVDVDRRSAPQLAGRAVAQDRSCPSSSYR